MGSLLATQLQAVMQEGLLDSLLPFLTQADKILYKPQDLSSETDSAGAAFFPLSSLSRSRNSDMKSRQNSSARLSRELTKEDKLVRALVEREREIVIHVCDENRGAKKDFTCPQGLLMEKMEYFREITDGQVGGGTRDFPISINLSSLTLRSTWRMSIFPFTATSRYLTG